MEQVERQLASLTGLVQTALTVGSSSSSVMPQQAIRADQMNCEVPASSSGAHHHPSGSKDGNLARRNH